MICCKERSEPKRTSRTYIICGGLAENNQLHSNYCISLYIQVFDLRFSHGMPRANPIPNDLFTSKIRIILNDLWIECPTIKQQLHQAISTTSIIKLLVPGRCRHGDLEFFQHPQCRPMLSASGRKPVFACSLVEPQTRVFIHGYSLFPGFHISPPSCLVFAA